MTMPITFNDINISKWLDGILLVTRNVGQNRVPQLDQVGRSDGKMFSYIRADEGTITVTAIVRTEVNKKRRLLADALTTSTPAKLVFADEPDVYYNAISNGQITLDEAYLHNTLTITFTVPDGIAHSVATKTFDNMPYKDIPVNFAISSHGFASNTDKFDTYPINMQLSEDLSGKTITTTVKVSVTNYQGKIDSSVGIDPYIDIKDAGSTGNWTGIINQIPITGNGVYTSSPKTMTKHPLTGTTNQISFEMFNLNATIEVWIKVEIGATASPWSPNPADPEYYTDTITVHNGGTYPVEPIITATMHADNGMVGIVNDHPGILQFGTQEIDGYTTDVSEKGLNGNFSAPISGTIYNQSATNNPNWGGDSSKPNKQTGSINYASDSYNGPHMEPAYASTGTYWNGPAAKIPIAATSQNTRNNNFTLTMMLHFETTVSELGRMELTLEAGGKVQYQMVVTDNNAVKDEIQVDCYVKDQQVGTMSLDRSKFTNDKLMQARLSRFGSSINFEVSPWNGKSGREMTVSLPPLTRPDMISENVEAFSVWFERNNTWGQAAMRLIAVQFDWQHVNWWTDIKNRFSNGDVLTIDVANAKTYLNGSENRTLHTIGNQWEQFKLPPGDTEITITPSSWAQPFACEVEIREAWL
ncbi:phage tail family protein [Lacticaseibacillus paracasei]|uniref:distal tail protein Dit n=1 Tax=Lacticaseibacillus paracasei TaxID=1597 RepID=UPI00237F6724|nr:distal tail protein Dit [Lacticaseibacillus paracasei]MDE3291474.1 phage tail family protein [Lacticaseibacillus paracasei]